MARVRPNSKRCSFCGKDQDQVSRLISGPGVYICDRCVDLCNEVIAGAGPGCEPPTPSAPKWRAWPDLPLVVRTRLRNLFRVSAPTAG